MVDLPNLQESYDDSDAGESESYDALSGNYSPDPPHNDTLPEPPDKEAILQSFNVRVEWDGESENAQVDISFTVSHTTMRKTELQQQTCLTNLISISYRDLTQLRCI